MKFYLFVLLNLLVFSNPSFAMDQLDNEFQRGMYGKILPPTNPDDFRVQNPLYAGNSCLYQFGWPKATLIKIYNSGMEGFIIPLFFASLHKAYLSQPLEDILTQQLHDYRRVYSFIIQSMDKSDGGGTKFHALKPHAFVHYRAPRFYEGETFTTPLLWTAVPGTVGHVEPLKGSLQVAGLLSDEICTHPGEGNGMVISPDNMHLKGVNHNNSVNLTSLMAFVDDRGNKIVSITHHLLLNEQDEQSFYDVDKDISTLRQLVYSLERQGNFKDFLCELKQYIGLLPRMDNLHPTTAVVHRESLPNKIEVITDCNANAAYQLVSNRFAVAESQKIRVSYTLDVQEEGKIALGLLNTNGNGWLTEIPLSAGFHDDVVEVTVPGGESSLALVLRNYHLGTPGQSTFTVHHTAVEVQGQPVNLQLEPTPYPTNITSKSGLFKVTTDNNADASYQLVSNRFPVAEGEKVRSSYTLHVQDGGIISLGFLNTLGNGWYPSQTAEETDELILKAGYHKGVMERIVPKGEAHAALVVRNYHLPWNGGAGQSTFTLYDLSVDKNR